MAEIDVVKKAYFRRDGRIDYSVAYDSIGGPIFGLWSVTNDKQLGFVDDTGKIVIPVIYDRDSYVSLNATSKAFALKRNGQYYLVKADGTVLFSNTFSDINLQSLHDDFLPVSIGNKWGFVDLKHCTMPVIPQYDKVSYFQNGYAPVCNLIDGVDRWGIVNEEGSLVLPTVSLHPSYFSPNFCIQYLGRRITYNEYCVPKIMDGNCRIVNKQGNTIAVDGIWISQTGPDTFEFMIPSKAGGNTIMVKRFIPYNFNGKTIYVVVNGGHYYSGWMTPAGKFYPQMPPLSLVNAEYFIHAHYAGGGTITALDDEGRPVRLTPEMHTQINQDLHA